MCSGVSVSLGDLTELRAYRIWGWGGAVLDIKCVLVPTLPPSSCDGPALALHASVPGYSLSLNLMEVS